MDDKLFDRLRGDAAGRLVSGRRYNDHALSLTDGRVSLEDWTEYDAQMRANFMGRTGLSLRYRDFETHPRAASAPPLGTGTTIKIACVSPSFWVDDPRDRKKDDPQPDLIVKDHRDGCRLCEATSDQISDLWIKERLEELGEALSHKPDIVCFSELSYPPPPTPEKYGWTIEAMSMCSALRARFEKEALRMIAKAKLDHPPFVFLGSYHCLLTLYSVGVVYPWGTLPGEVRATVQNESWNDSEGPAVDVEKLQAPILYKKRYPARRVGESTRVPASANLDVFKIGLGRIALLLCSDVLDLNQFLAIARRNALPDRERIDYVLVPSFNQSRKLATMCCELSYAAQCAVILVNANEHNSSFPPTDVFACGLPSSDLRKVQGLGSGLKVMPQAPKVGTLQRKHGRDATVKCYELNVAALRGFANDLRNAWSD